MHEALLQYVRAGYGALVIVSPEERRVEAEVKAIAEHLDFRLYAWSVTTGLVDTADTQSWDCTDPLDAVERIRELPEHSLVLLRDFHLHLDDPSPLLIRHLKETVAHCREKGSTMILSGCRNLMPPELEREFTVVDLPLPDREQLQAVVEAIAGSAELDLPKDEDLPALLDAASGLTSIEAENALSLSIVETSSLTPAVVAREKAQAIRQNGLLEIIDDPGSPDDIGGLDQLKEWLGQRRNAFGPAASEFGLPSPKGLLIVGVPGTGKSLTAKATAAMLGRPLLKLDAGRLFAGLVGQSESNLRSVIATAEAIAPCVLFIDEIEKGFGGNAGSANTDGGTSARVFGSLLNWLQDKTAPVFVVATANDVSALPPEFLRAGRWDALFSVDLPTPAERTLIWEIQLKRHCHDPGRFDTEALARATDGYTGAEIEQVIVEGLYSSFEREQEPSTLSMSIASERVVPLSRTIPKPIQYLRDWAKGRARPASSN